ncbi:MAG: MBL fold metallo-hydrolase [Patescibacteria group bacterium]|nr:MAG: MBL fold metallo-hydrolase [Patescibacteria group bacterium]
MSIRIRLTRLGARRTPDGIEPSCGVMDIQKGSESYRIVTDCGLIPVRAQEPGQDPSWHVPDLSFFEDGKPIDAVRLTHVHGDHAGFTPALAKYLGPKAKVWMTSPSEAMIPNVFEDGLKAFERARVRPLFDENDVADVHLRIRRIFKPGPFEILPGITDYVHPEGHIGGACSFTTLVGGKRVHYSGDRCSHDQPGIRGAQLLPREWYPHVIANSDCTYGADPDSDRRSWREEMDRGLEQCAATLRAGAPVLFCSFGIHRGGAVIHELSRHGVPNLAPVYLDGSCRTYTEIAMSDRGRWSELDTLLHVDGVRWIGREKGERYEASQPRAYAVVSTPGMGGPGGAAAFWKRQVLPNPDALLVFTGYLAPDTDGARILEADAERRRTGVNPVLAFEDQDPDGRPRVERLPFRCKVLQIRIGAHDSQGNILEWFRGYRPETAVLCHGSEAALASLSSSLEGDIPQVVRSDQQRTIELEF